MQKNLACATIALRKGDSVLFGIICQLSAKAGDAMWKFSKMPTLVLALLLGGVNFTAAVAEPTFMWGPNDAQRSPTYPVEAGYIPNAFCNVPGRNSVNCGSFFSNRRDTTPFVQEIVTVDGVDYYHTVVGDPAKGFAQETYIGVGSGLIQGTAPSSASTGSIAGQGCFGFLGRPPNPDACGNGVNPLKDDNTFTGNASGNPRKVIMRQIVSDGESYQEFIKSSFTQKPVIVQRIENDTLKSEVKIDMSGLNYDSNATAGSVQNTLMLKDPVAGDTTFDAVKQAEAGQSTINAGRYTYTETPNTFTAGAGGTYQYLDGDYNLNTNWASFRNPLQNEKDANGNPLPFP